MQLTCPKHSDVVLFTTGKAGEHHIRMIVIGDDLKFCHKCSKYYCEYECRPKATR